MDVLLGILLLFAFCVIIYKSRSKTDSPQSIGDKGEARVHDILMQLPEDYHVLDNVILENGKKTTQIDHIVISKYGVFVIETKNYRGEIYGNDNREKWTQIIATDVNFRKKWYKTYTYITKNHFYNPVKQSMGHVNAVKKLLTAWPYLKIVPIVVFLGDADISKVQSDIYVIKGYELTSAILKFQTTYLTDEESLNVAFLLSQNNVSDTVDNKTHIRNVIATKEEYYQKLAADICPRCGGTLVLKSGRYGRFYGCSNYPRCSFTAR